MSDFLLGVSEFAIGIGILVLFIILVIWYFGGCTGPGCAIAAGIGGAIFILGIVGAVVCLHRDVKELRK